MGIGNGIPKEIARKCIMAETETAFSEAINEFIQPIEEEVIALLQQSRENETAVQRQKVDETAVLAVECNPKKARELEVVTRLSGPIFQEAVDKHKTIEMFYDTAPLHMLIEEERYRRFKKHQKQVHAYRENEGLFLSEPVDNVPDEPVPGVQYAQHMDERERTSFKKYMHYDIDFHQRNTDPNNPVYQKTGGLWDVIIGNPPYTNIKGLSDRIKPNSYRVKHNSDLAPYFVERDLQLMKEDSRLGLVLPIRIITLSNNRDVREVMLTDLKELKMWGFGADPTMMFPGVRVDCVLTTGVKGSGDGRADVYTSQLYHKLDRNEKVYLKGIESEVTRVPDKLLREEDNIPKLGHSKLVDIVQKIKTFSNSSVYSNLGMGEGVDVYFAAAPGTYHTRALNFKPVLSKPCGEVYLSSGIKHYSMEEESANLVMLIFNSGLMQAVRCVYDGGMNVYLTLLEHFKIPTGKRDSQLEKELIHNMMESYKRHSTLDNFQGGKKQTFHPRKCKAEIDAIDTYLGQLYGLTQQEIEFIHNYDIHVRA